MVRERLLPDDETLNKVAPYEAHLSRQLYQALHELVLYRRSVPVAWIPRPPRRARDRKLKQAMAVAESRSSLKRHLLPSKASMRHP
jgi:hypothetical protein